MITEKRGGRGGGNGRRYECGATAGRGAFALALSSRKMAAAPSWKRWSGAGEGMASDRRGSSSPGPPPSRWSGGLASIGCRRSRGSSGPRADHRVGPLSPGTWPSCARF